MSWGVYEQRNDEGEFVAYHIMPCLTIEGEDVRSGDHTLSSECECGPLIELGRHGQVLYQHYDPDFPGALSKEEWDAKTKGISK